MLSEALWIYTLVCAEAPTSGMCRSRANTNMSCTLRHHHVAFLSGLSCRNCCGEFGQMCTSALWPGKCLHIKGDLESYLVIQEESERTSAHGWPLVWSWGEALLFFPCCCSLIVFECSKGSSLSLSTGLSMMGGSYRTSGGLREILCPSLQQKYNCWVMTSKWPVKVTSLKMRGRVVAGPCYCEEQLGQY